VNHFNYLDWAKKFPFRIFRLINESTEFYHCPMELTVEKVVAYYKHPLHVAAALNRMSVCDFKKLYKALGIKRWPYHKTRKNQSNVGGFLDFKLLPSNGEPQITQKKNPNKKKDSKNVEKSLDLEIYSDCVNLEFDDVVNEMVEMYFESQKL
jgi:hypothetical protein